ncbi:leucine-rich repeat transmembrane neuronal protein 2-like [Anopheles ziemanni]|uniref:leucine-rich repeat transmembrane neuronal protein 2-like n=1 Tax=Anopheles coustani TaxID=139045 RepID=UPI0026582A05|nr:leucine-rich repeat transmembrane neuronal protein 2-like [Anopheles coustani]XP_058178777.1 leucine-rich repeat transmembrane neuronal protein 2-like [Anopheles ziemanni]
MGMANTCMLASLNMSSDGIATLRKIPPGVFYAISVELVRMPENPSGVFLQRMAEFVNKIEIYKYNEQVFQILPGTSLNVISVYTAPSLNQVVIAPSLNISELYIGVCPLVHIPPTIRNLELLEDFTITRCTVKEFSFDLFTNNLKLDTLDLSFNEIRSIVPTTIKTPFTLAIENLYLHNNLLEALDMTAFVSLGALRGLDLGYNNLLTIAAQSTVTWPAVDFLNLQNNNLTTLDLQWLSAPNLQRLLLDNNKFQAIPQRLRRFPSLQLVAMSNNLLKSIDLAPFNGLPNLNSIDLSYNKEARGIRASRPVSLPMLTTLYAENCALARFNTSGLDLPAINYISLSHNNFTTVPRLVAAFPALGSFGLEYNPLPCTTVQALTENIMAGRLILGLPQDPEDCTSGYVTLKGSLTLCCKK